MVRVFGNVVTSACDEPRSLFFRALELFWQLRVQHHVDRFRGLKVEVEHARHTRADLPARPLLLLHVGVEESVHLMEALERIGDLEKCRIALSVSDPERLWDAHSLGLSLRGLRVS